VRSASRTLERYALKFCDVTRRACFVALDQIRRNGRTNECNVRPVHLLVFPTRIFHRIIQLLYFLVDLWLFRFAHITYYIG